MSYSNKFPNFNKQNLFNEIVSGLTATIAVYLLGYCFNFLADYRGITLLPGIRKGFHYIINNLVDDNIFVLQDNSLEWQLGLGSIEIILCIVWFLQARLLFQLIAFKTKTRKVKKEIKKQAIDTGKLILLISAINLIPLFLLQNLPK
ncbi:MAG: hypothetical protein QNJ38_15580 [Prochloraceae cyanobacterium]|nr:hypothetical protein [Prochloraceae cyanobacterium]